MSCQVIVTEIAIDTYETDGIAIDTALTTAITTDIAIA